MFSVAVYSYFRESGIGVLSLFGDSKFTSLPETSFASVSDG
jgi:hypothetical protein